MTYAVEVSAAEVDVAIEAIADADLDSAATIEWKQIIIKFRRK